MISQQQKKSVSWIIFETAEYSESDFRVISVLEDGVDHGLNVSVLS